MKDILDILPFKFLDAGGRKQLLDTVLWQQWTPGKVLVRQGDLTDDRVYLLASGTVDVINHHKGPDTRIDQIEAGHYFGERPALFGTPRAVEVRAATECETASLSGEQFLEIVQSQPHVAHALTFIIRDKQAMFADVNRFLAEVRHGATTGYIVIAKLLHAFRRVRPALHRNGHTRQLDFNALSYVVNRLPSNLTTSFVWFATDDFPPRYEAASSMFRDTTAVARRRPAWEMLPGKSLLLLRDGMSDLLDLTSCLCVYSIEARKLRRRLQRAGVLQRLGGADAETALAEVFTPAERAGLETLWPEQVPRRLVEMSLHHEDITIHVYKRTNNYNSAHAETWTKQIARATREVLGLEPWALADDFPVHIISSNTHSVTNCLSPWLAKNHERILDWGEAHRPEIMGGAWHHADDRVVALIRDFFAANPEAEAERALQDKEVCVQLDETAFTGIGVQLFCLKRVAAAGLDRGLPTPTGPGLVVNIDYAFGQQAEPIIANLVNLFGRRIRSINVLGKAGGLRGERGDVLVAQAFVNQTDDVVQHPPIMVDIDRLRARLPDRQIHCGRVLTVLGTVVQNDLLLHFYDKLWDCVGLEMEGSYYCRQVMECRDMGLLREDVALRFLYYISDLPLNRDASLASAMTPQEGIPPLYATTREVLTAILG